MIHHFGFFLIRRPVESIRQIFHLHQQLSDASLEALLKTRFLSEALLREAILIASPALHERMECWLRDGKVTEKEQLLYTLYKYLIRASTRCTPFGLFSCTGMGEIHSGGTLLTIPDEEMPVPRTFPDVEIARALTTHIVGMPMIRSQLALYPNSSLYDAGTKYHYIETTLEDTHNEYFISSIEASDALTLMLKRARGGASMKDLVALLMAGGFSHDESLEFVQTLIENQILEFKTGASQAAPDFLPRLIRKLSPLAGTGDLTEHLIAMDQKLNEPAPIAAKIQSMRHMLSGLGIIPSNHNLLKVDSYASFCGHRISATVIGRLSKLAEKLMVLNHTKIPPALDRFRDRFTQKYGDREVSLPLALDDETGIGYAQQTYAGAVYAPMIDDLEIATARQEPVLHETWWQQFIIEKYTQAVCSSRHEIKLTDDDLELIHGHTKSADDTGTASSFYLFGNLLAHSQDELDRGDFLFNLLACQGPSAIHMLSRFAGGLTGLTGQLQECVKREETHHSDVIFAEIAHLPEGRAGNVVSRPKLYTFEVPYLGQATVSEENCIPVDDLMVSVRENRIMLRSKKWNRRVIPRNSTMHNYEKGLPVYRFLCDLQYQDSNLNISWDWGILRKQQHLPRVRYQNMIVSRESWLISTEQLKSAAPEDIPGILTKWCVPDLFTVASGDNELLIDTRVPESVKLLRELCRKDNTIRLMEFLSTPDLCAVRQSDLPFVSEIVIPFLNPSARPLQGYSVPDFKLPPQLFLLGSEWLYLKIYVSEKSNEQLLIRILTGVVHQLKAKKTVDLFFFVRYRDPEHHLRLRFKGNAAKKFYQEVLHEIHLALSPLIDAGIVNNIQTDTYCREIERYGWNTIESCEKLFQIDSLETMDFLAAGDGNENERFMFAIRKINLILDHAGYALMEKHALLGSLKESFVLEFNGNVVLRKKLNQKYQLYKYLIETALQIRDERLDYQQQFLMQEIVGESNRSASYPILSSLIHMSINRIFPAKQRLYELMIYHCLYKYFDSLIARSRQIA